MLNSVETHELPYIGFAGLHQRSAFEFSFTNGGANTSYGCNDYMPTMFKTYLTDVLLQDDDNDDEEEIRSLGLAESNEEHKYSPFNVGNPP